MRVFFDTNILVYALTGDARGIVAQQGLSEGGVSSAQVLDEFVRVMRKKLRLDWNFIETALFRFRTLVGPVRDITVSTHEAAVALARDHGLDIYDALIVASALEAGCDTLLTEDMQDGRVFAGLTIRNPFLQGPP